MWDIIKKNKYSVGLVAAAVVGIVLYGVFFVGGEEEEPAASPDEGNTVTETQIGAEVTELVSKLEGISFGDSLFDDSAYRSLRAFGYSPAPKETGRDNPFAPIRLTNERDLIRTAE